MYRRCLIHIALAAFALAPLGSAAQRKFDFDAGCREAYREIMMMKTPEGKRLIEAEKKAHPDNLAPYFLDNYIDLFTLFFHEDAAEYREALPDRDKRIALMKEGPQDSPFYLFTQAMIYAQWGIIKLKYGENFSSMWDFRRAYFLIQDNQRKFPAFAPNKIVLGSLQTVISTIPSGYRWITNILGFTGGSVNKGLAQLASYVNDSTAGGGLFHEEAFFYYAYLRFYVAHQPDAVMQLIRNGHLDLVHNALYAFMAANLALNNHEASYGLQVLERMKRGPEYLSMPVLNYEMGTLKLYHLELDDAITYLKRFTSEFRGKFYLKDALFKLSWAYYLNGDRTQAEACRQRVLTQGNEVVDADKVALREAQKNRWPDTTILEARMLMNGGYFQEALRRMQSRKIEDYTSLTDKLEYAYFLARTYDELGNDDLALSLYAATIRSGADRPEYYAARAALQSAFIYEQRKDTVHAVAFFKKCLDMHEQEYKSTLDQRAKAGLNRLTVH